ncbi:MAG: Ig-like domain-containing protein, partial [Bacteroidia bacterium]|nr:Ig-like domain-containing protein [Bacteroidia bacterium]
VSVGNGNFRNVGSGNSVCDFWFGKTSISSFVKFVRITGINFINQNSGSIQLFAEILPATATNKIINWSIDDTSKALITQTGLLTAKANGVVTVVAKTTDGSNLSASKQITITNQGVGFIYADELMKRIDVYPNPAKSSVSVKSDFVKINWVQLLDIHSKTLATVSNSENIDISDFANGYYLLKIETEKGTVFKKLMINK